MINMKPAVVTALSSISLLNGRIYPIYPISFANTPSLSYSEVDNSLLANADDREYSANIEFSIDIWDLTGTNLSSLKGQVNTKMVNLGFTRTRSTDLAEKETGMHHTNMRFRIVKEV